MPLLDLENYEKIQAFRREYSVKTAQKETEPEIKQDTSTGEELNKRWITAMGKKRRERLQ